MFMISLEPANSRWDHFSNLLNVDPEKLVVLTIFTGPFGINVDGIAGAESTVHAFGKFSAILIFIGLF